MTTWQERADEALAHNVADVLENGPRLAWTRKSAEIAIDRRNKYVLRTGLGALGVGTMWCDYSYRSEEPAEWADLPEQDSTGGFGGPRSLVGDELIAWVMGVLAEDEQRARSFVDMGISIDVNLAGYAFRAFADIEAKRAILDLHGHDDLHGACKMCLAGGVPCRTVRWLASAYADRPGYREEWRP